MVAPGTVRRLRQAAEVISIACARCGGRGWHLEGDDYTWPREVTCRTCGGRGLVALTPCADCEDTGVVDGDLCCFCPTGERRFWAWEQRQDPAAA